MKSILKHIDQWVAVAHLKFFKERNALISLLVHGLFENEDQLNANYADPLEGMTVQHFRFIVEHFLENGYRFISEKDILKGLDKDQKYLYLTFDDGYFNNILALPVLNEFHIPATFFISTNHVQQQKSFWWDVLYREWVKQGASLQRIRQEQNAFKGQEHTEIEAALEKTFGKNALRPRDDIDRPMTPDELKRFSEDPNVLIGNHTTDHAILTNYSREGAWDQIKGAQEALTRMIGIMPEIISYPNGNYSNETIDIAKEAGLKMGITVRPYKDRLPLIMDGIREMTISRFIPKGNESLTKQCELIRSEGSVIRGIKKMYNQQGT